MQQFLKVEWLFSNWLRCFWLLKSIDQLLKDHSLVGGLLRLAGELIRARRRVSHLVRAAISLLGCLLLFHNFSFSRVINFRGWLLLGELTQKI